MKKIVPVIALVLLGLIYSCSTEPHPNCYYIDRINVRLVDYLGEDTFKRSIVEPFKWDRTNDLAGISVEFIQVFYADKNAKHYRSRRSGSIEPGQAGSRDSIFQFLIAAVDSTKEIITLNDLVSPARDFASIEDFVDDFNARGRRTKGTRLRNPIILLIDKNQLKQFKELKTVIEIGTIKVTTTIFLDNPPRYSY